MNGFSALLPIDLALAVVVWWLGLGALSLVLMRRSGLVLHGVFPGLATGSLALVAAGAWGLHAVPGHVLLPFGLPDLPFHLRQDSLSSFFLLLLGLLSFGVTLFSSGYFRHLPARALALLSLQLGVFLASMALVLLADDAYLFLVAWEGMAISSYFLVTTEHELPETRKAGFIYLLMAHVGAVAILLAFGVLQGDASGYSGYTFAGMRAGHLTAAWASIAFFLAFFGFGAKAGLFPLHIWLPEAHPAAPSPVSALMSGAMLKTAIYGILRVGFDLVHLAQWWWGPVVLVIGLVTALFGVIYAAVQTDMKRLLAYSSIENIGIILSAIGLAITFHAFGHVPLAALALTAALYHSLNHAMFKGLLFLGTGSVLHATGERLMGRLGGLLRQMPWAGMLVLVGTLAIAGLPPLNGFVSEWLLLQAFLLAPVLPEVSLSILLPLAAAALALAGALAAYVMVKFYGIIFLGRPREAAISQAHDAGIWERLGMGWLALGCILLGLLPAWVIQELDAVTRVLIGQGLGRSAAREGWLWLTPVAAERASYSPVIYLLIVLVMVLLTFAAVRHFFGGPLRRTQAWNCGYPVRTARMQDTAEGFGEPIRRIFDPAFEIEREMPDQASRAPRYRIQVRDPSWRQLYGRIAGLIGGLAQMVGRLQQGRIAIYLLYSFVTLLVLLAFVTGRS